MNWVYDALLPGAAQIQATGLAPIPIALGTFTLTGQAVVVRRRIPIGAGSFTLTGQAVVPRRRKPIAAGSYTLTGQAIIPRRRIPIAVGTYTLSGQAILRKRRTPISVGSYTLTGFGVTPTFSSLGAIEVGTFTLTGYPVRLARRIPIAAGSYTLTGRPVVLRRRKPIGVGSFALTGFGIDFSVFFSVSLGVGSFTLTGMPITVNLANIIIGKGTRFYNQIATYWARAADDGYGGYTYASPQKFVCRWQERVEELRTKEGELVISNATVWLPSTVEEGGYLYLGASSAADPASLHEAYVIRRVVDTPAIRGRKVEHRVYL